MDPGLATAAVDLRDVAVRIAGRRVLGPLSLRVAAGERWAILGPNGSGKTTLLALIGGWRHPSEGSAAVLGIRFGHGDVRALRRSIGHVSHMLAERFAPASPIEEVVLTGRASTVARWPRAVDRRERERATELLGQVGCAHLAQQAFGACSQGERQRVLLARALFHPTDLLLLDEPAAGLDLPGREGLIQAIDGIVSTDGADTADGADAMAARLPAILMATHHLDEIPASVTHAALLRGGELIGAGPVAGVLTPEALGRCFGMTLVVERREGRWTAFATSGSRPLAVP